MEGLSWAGYPHGRFGGRRNHAKTVTDHGRADRPSRTLAVHHRLCPRPWPSQPPKHSRTLPNFTDSKGKRSQFKEVNSKGNEKSNCSLWDNRSSHGPKLVTQKRRILHLIGE